MALTKPRIIMLLLFTALGGMFLAAQGTPDVLVMVVVLVAGTLASAGANALNQWFDRDIDEAMSRTRSVLWSWVRFRTVTPLLSASVPTLSPS